MLSKLQNIAHNRWYWLALAAVGLSFISIALYYQYVLEEQPCLLCIQARLWVTAFILVSLIALVFPRKWTNISSHLLTVVIAAGLLERSYQLLGTERGFVFSDCGFDLGLPAWLALDTWFPALFRVETSCGYTPELIFGITMAEALIVFATLLLLTSLSLTVAALARQGY